MKKNKFLTFILFIFSMFFVQAQEKNIETAVFTLDMGVPTKNAITGPDGTRRLVFNSKQLLAFNLINANPYKYRYEINSEIVNFFDGDVSEVFKALSTTPEGGEESVEENAKLKQDLLKESDPETFKGNAELFLDIEKQRLEKAENLDILEDRSKLMAGQNSLRKSLYAIPDDDDLFSDGKEDYLKQLKEFSKNIEKAIEEEQLKRADEMNTLYSDIENYLLEVTAEDYLDKGDFKRSRILFKTNYDAIVRASNKINQLLNDDCNEQLKTFEAAAEKVKTVLTKMFSLKLDNYLLPIDVAGKNIDVVRVTVKRYHKQDENQESDEHTYTFWVKGGLKIDVGAGIAISSLTDREYFTMNNEAGTAQVIREKDLGNYAYGISTLVNVSFRGGSWVLPTLNVGTLITQNQKVQLLAGIGVVLGKEQRIVLHGGLAMGSVTTLSNRYLADGTTEYNLSDDDAISTVEKFSFGHFFGLTYNFGKPKAKEKE